MVLGGTRPLLQIFSAEGDVRIRDVSSLPQLGSQRPLQIRARAGLGNMQIMLSTGDLAFENGKVELLAPFGSTSIEHQSLSGVGTLVSQFSETSASGYSSTNATGAEASPVLVASADGENAHVTLQLLTPHRDSFGWPPWDDIW